MTMGMRERYEQMIEYTGCNPHTLALVFNTGALGIITAKEVDRGALTNARDKFAYTQTIDGVTRGFILAVGRHGSFSNFNLQDENFEYVKFEYNPEEVIS